VVAVLQVGQILQPLAILGLVAVVVDTDITTMVILVCRAALAVAVQGRKMEE
jgi:hypothetical protein